MSLTKEMMVHIQEEVARLPDDLLVVYYHVRGELNSKYPCSFYKYEKQTAFDEIMRRGIEGNLQQNDNIVT